MDAALEQKLKRLMLFRVVMITTLLLIAVYVEMVSETLLWVNPLYFLIATTYALTLLYVALLNLRRYGEAQIYFQVLGDFAIVTGLVYLTGGTGTRAGFLLLYPISVLSGSILLSWRKGLVLAGLATLCYGLILLFAFTMLWVGMLLGTVARSADAVTGIVFIVIFPMTFVANAFVPAGTLPGVLQTVAEWNPVSALAAGLRTLFGNPTATPHDAAWPLQHPVASSFMWCAALLAVTVPLAIAAYRRRTEG